MSRDLGICCKLVSVSEPFLHGALIELVFHIPQCGEIEGGGEIAMRVSALDAPGWMVGDQYFIHLRSL